MGVEFRPLDEDEQKRLGKALRGNAEKGDALFMSPKDTRFLASDEADESIEQTIAAIRSVPVHYFDGPAVEHRDIAGFDGYRVGADGCVQSCWGRGEIRKGKAWAWVEAQP